MTILLTGATGYIAQRLLPVLLEQGHRVISCVRDAQRFNPSALTDRVSVIEADLLDRSSLERIPRDIDAAFYLIHSMASPSGEFDELEKLCAVNFRDRISQTAARQVVYLSGIVNETELSRHLSSRRTVEELLGQGPFALTTLRAGIIVGSGSASFEIIRDLVEKLPVMVTPRWLNTRTQPISVRNVLEFLSGVLGKEETYGRNYDIAGPDILTYREMLLRFAAVRGLKRRIYVVPVLTPRISSYWLFFVTATSFALAKHLVDSMKVEVVGRPNDLAGRLGIRLIDYDTSLRLALDKGEQDEVLSSWTDALSVPALSGGIARKFEVPVNGCYRDIRRVPVQDPERSLEKIWSIGGKRGWYHADWLWELRGFLDQIAGGVGMRRGRKNDRELRAGESLDFWRVLIANRKEHRLLLFAEMKLPGEAWLEFRIDEKNVLVQTATFRTLGVLGRLYWYSVLPFHHVIFNGMAKAIARRS
jgi:uncharacterized protein YbjT (DUF2867 family)